VAVNPDGGIFSVTGIANHEEAGSCWASWIHRATWAGGDEATIYEHDVQPDGDPNGRIYVSDGGNLRAWKYGGDGGFPTSASAATPPAVGGWRYLVIVYRAAGAIELYYGDEATPPAEVGSYAEEVDNIVATYWNESATGIKGRFSGRANNSKHWSGGALEGYFHNPVLMTHLPSTAEMDEMRLGTFNYTGKGVMFRLQTTELPITDIGPNTYTVAVESGTMLLVDDPEPEAAGETVTPGLVTASVIIPGPTVQTNESDRHYLHFDHRRGGDGWPG
jgi:hypothetical protein